MKKIVFLVALTMVTMATSARADLALDNQVLQLQKRTLELQLEFNLLQPQLQDALNRQRAEAIAQAEAAKKATEAAAKEQPAKK